ncbi:MAG: hypothetical protein ACRD1T_02470 [Acidimicrobiia bacterium]
MEVEEVEVVVFEPSLAVEVSVLFVEVSDLAESDSFLVLEPSTFRDFESVE